MEHICPVCLENDENFKRLKCNHLLCEQCFCSWRETQFQNKRNFDCPQCKNVEIEYTITINEETPIPTETMKKFLILIFIWFLIVIFLLIASDMHLL